MPDNRLYDLVYNGRHLLTEEGAISRVVLNGQVIWPLPAAGDPTIQRVVFNGQVLWARSSEPYLNVEKQIVFLDEYNDFTDINRIFTNTTFIVD